MHTLPHESAAVQPVVEASGEQKQARLMRVALGLLLTALLVVTAKDWSFWSDFFFPEEQVAESPAPTQATAQVTTAQATSQSVPAVRRPKSKQSHAPQLAHENADAAISPIITTSNRRVLPPLEVDVVAGNRHQTVQATKRSIQVDMQPSSPSDRPEDSLQGSVATNAVDRVVVSPDTSGVVSRPVEPNYPVLAKQMKVQGKVTLQALIGKTGSIQNLRVLSGPAILSDAAREAVKQWHFKPYLLAGRPVETEARITVNFTISTD